MSKICPIIESETNRTNCIAEEKRYSVKAYICTNFAGLMDSLETDDFYEAQEFVWENCQKGFNCEFYDTKTGNHNWAYADDFAEDTEEPDELLRDLRMEQCEQM